MPAVIDTYLPQYDVRECHQIDVEASPAATFAALRSTDLAASPLVRVLLGLRALPGALRRGRAGLRALWVRRPKPITIAAFEAAGFRVLAENPPWELVLGLEGQFWRPVADLRTPPDALVHTRVLAPGTARGVWSFALRARGDGTTELSTETRVHCADAEARRRFLPYWYLIRPASGIIRRSMLRAVRRSAERADAQARVQADATERSGRWMTGRPRT